MPQRKTRVLWAIDALENHNEMQGTVVTALQALAKGQAVEIQPFTLLSREEIKWITDDREEVPFLVPEDVEASLRSWLENLPLPGLLSLEVVERDTLTPAAAANLVAQRARATHADLIAVGTHHRQGVERWILGSFTETLVLESKTPVLVLGPRTQVRDMSQIVFATDFSEAARKAFEKIVTLAAGRHATVTLLHQVEGNGAAGSIDTPDDRKAARNLAELWANWARHTGVTVKVHIDERRGNTAEDIVDFAKSSRADVIVVATQAGAIRAAVLGSVTRSVLRAAECPVIAWHP